MASETGHTKNLTNFETLILTCTGFGTTYNPSNPTIQTQNLETKHLETKNKIQEVKTTQDTFNDIEGQNKQSTQP